MCTLVGGTSGIETLEVDILKQRALRMSINLCVASFAEVLAPLSSRHYRHGT